MATVNPYFKDAGSQKVASIWPSSLHALLDEGSLFLACSTDVATGKAQGTAIATTTSVVDDAATASATHAQNVPVMYWANPQAPSATDGTTLYPIALKMVCAQAPTSATVWNVTFRADNTPRYTSGGTAVQGKNLNLASSKIVSSAQLYFGAVVTTPLPSANQRVLVSTQVHSAIPTTKDVWIFTFGDMTMPSSILTAAAAKNINVPCQPFCVPPGWNVAMEMWGTSNAAATSWEFEFIFAERFAGL